MVAGSQTAAGRFIASAVRVMPGSAGAYSSRMAATSRSRAASSALWPSAGTTTVANASRGIALWALPPSKRARS